jgi:hypothetical protein
MSAPDRDPLEAGLLAAFRQLSTDTQGKVVGFCEALALKPEFRAAAARSRFTVIEGGSGRAAPAP